MMAIAYILSALQVVSIIVNVLALGAFWVTPGLRTNANKFVINLLFVNIIGCLAVTPALWLGTNGPSDISRSHNALNNHSQPLSSIMAGVNAAALINHNGTIELYNGGVVLNDGRIQTTAFTSTNHLSGPTEPTTHAEQRSQRPEQQQHSDRTGAPAATTANVKNDCVHNSGAGAHGAAADTVDTLNCDDTIHGTNDINTNIYPDAMAKISISRAIESDVFNDGETLAIFGAEQTENGAMMRQQKDTYHWMQYWPNSAIVECQHFWGMHLAGALGEWKNVYSNSSFTYGNRHFP